jgi:hypothetical protein
MASRFEVKLPRLTGSSKPAPARCHRALYLTPTRWPPISIRRNERDSAQSNQPTFVRANLSGIEPGFPRWAPVRMNFLHFGAFDKTKSPRLSAQERAKWDGRP